ncbi:hypothetical protein LCGC14_0393970 [marine sediment metagenome]|uniref:Uncharacterized protein n=1 Tax=marine sediment metagenome TaxID=412755 RepID=A0A0F9TGM9_9ZZZZ
MTPTTALEKKADAVVKELEAAKKKELLDKTRELLKVTESKLKTLESIDENDAFPKSEREELLEEFTDRASGELEKAGREMALGLVYLSMAEIKAETSRFFPPTMKPAAVNAMVKCMVVETFAKKYVIPALAKEKLRIKQGEVQPEIMHLRIEIQRLLGELGK